MTEENNITGILDNSLEYRQPQQHIRLKKTKNQYYSKLKKLLPCKKD